MPITPGGRWSPSDGDDWDLTTDLAAMQVSNESATATEITNALAGVKQNYRVGTDAQRLAISGADLFEGLQFYATDTNRDWFYDGAAWLPSDPGSYVVRPTSVVNGTIGADGRITPTAGAASISFNGLFTTRFRRYRVEYYFTTNAAAGSVLRLRAAGVDNSSANYGIQQHYASGSTAATQGLVGQQQWAHAAFAAQFLWGSIEFNNPAHTGAGMEKTVTGLVNGYLSQQVVNYSGLLSGGTGLSFDGFSLILSSSTFAAPGAFFRIYGLN